MVQLYSGKGAGAAANLDLKKKKSECFCFHSNRHFKNDIMNDL